MSDLFYDHELSETLAHSFHRLRLRTARRMREGTADHKKLVKSVAAIQKKWGTEALSPIKLMAERHDVPCVRTELQALDDIVSGTTEKVDGKRRWITGSGRGMPRGRIIEIFGPESSGKTTLSLELIARYQEQGFEAGFFDLEHALDLDYADAIGCDTDNWQFSQGADTGEESFDIILDIVRADVLDILVVDSVAALVPRSDLDAEMGEGQPGAHARLMSQGLRKLTALLKRGHKTTVVFINQTRSKIGGYGNPETTTGGNALRFYASVRLRISNAGEIKAGGEKGQRSKIKVRKTKLAVPYGECFIDITGGNGISACYAAKARNNNPLKDDEDGDDE